MSDKQLEQIDQILKEYARSIFPTKKIEFGHLRRFTAQQILDICQPQWISLESVLTEHEAAFVRSVFYSGGAKLSSFEATHEEDDGSEYGRTVVHWETPEKLGLIECVGSYKWKPTKRLAICIKPEDTA